MNENFESDSPDDLQERLKDQMLETSLREWLGGEGPPDLRASILAQLHSEPPTANPLDVVPPPFKEPAVVVEATSPLSASAPRQQNWLLLIAACAAMLLIAPATYYLFFASKNAEPTVAERTPLFPEGSLDRTPPEVVSVDPEPAPDIEPPDFGSSKLEQEKSSITSRDRRPPPSYRRLEERELLAQLRASLEKGWQESQIKPSPDATDAEWCRRTFLALVGRVPTVTELETFLASKAEDRREQLVARLLGDSDYAEESARRMATLWTNALIGRVGGRSPERLASRAGLVDYLTRAFRENRPFDRIVWELLTATGSSDPNAEDYNGAVNFLLDGFNRKATLATARTSRVFLGQQLQCVQCHDHPTAEISQAQFWGLNAFFRQMSVERKPNAAPRLVNVDFYGESRGSQRRPDRAEIFYELRNGELKAAYPTFPDGAPGPTSGLASEVDRRAALADWVVAQEELPRAVVNRVWSQLLGFGFTQPVDDLGPHNPPVHPEILEQLSQQFAAHQFDLKALTRWIVLSDAFSRSSRLTADNIADVPEQGARPLFSRYYTRQMDPESLFDSLRIASSLRRQDSMLLAKRAEWLGQFMSDLKTDEGDEHSTYDGGVPQSLAMMNGEAMMEAVSLAQGSTLGTVVSSDMPLPKKIEHLYLAALSRPPSAKELESATKLVGNAAGGPQAGLADLWWALLNSGEFILDH